MVQEAGIVGDGPSTVVSQTGMKKKAVDWVARAWTDIQIQQNWSFLWNTTSFNTTLGQRDYHPVDNLQLDPVLAVYIVDSFRIHGTSLGFADQGTLEYVSWADWSVGVQGHGAVNSGKPTQFTIMPNNTIRFNATPDVSYTVTFDYYQVPVELAANNDVPALPAQFHDMILYQALIYYAAHEDAAEIYQDATARFNAYMADLMQQDIATIQIQASPLA